MANKFTVSVDFLASTNIEKIAGTMNASMRNMQASSLRLSRTLQKNEVLFNNLSRTTTKATKAIGATFVAGMAASILVGSKYQEGLMDLSALTGVVGTDLDKMGKRALDASQKFGMSSPKILEMNKIIASSIPALLRQPELLADVTEQAIILGKASRMETAESTRALTTTLNQFNLEGTEAKRVINALAAGAKEGAGDIPFLSEAIEKAGTTFSLMGLDVEQSVAIVEAIAPKFKRASLAGNTLDKAFLKMRETGIGFTDGIFDLDVALNTIREGMDRGISVADTFGVEHAKVIEVLLQAQGEYGRYNEAVRGTSEAYVQAEKNMSTFREAVNQLGTAVQKRLIEVFIKMEPLLTRIVNRMKKFIQTIDFKALAKFAGAIVAIVAALWAFILPSKILAAIPVVKAIIQMTVAMWSFNAAILANPITWVIVAIIAAIALLGYAIYKYWDIVKPALVDVWLQAKEAFGPSLQTLWEMLKQLWTVAKPVLSFIAKVVGTVLVSAFLGFLQVLKWVMKYMEVMFKPIAWLLTKIQKLIDKRKELGEGGELGAEFGEAPKLTIPDTTAAIIGGPGQQTLDINMKVDSEGRPTIEGINSDGDINFEAELGHMEPIFGT